MGTKIGNHLVSLSASTVTVATKQYCHLQRVRMRQGRHALLLSVDLLSFANEPLCFLLPLHRLGNSCLWLDAGLMMFEPLWVNNLSVRLPFGASTFYSLKLSLMQVVLICLGILHSHDVVIVKQVRHIGIEVYKVEELHRVVVIVLCIKVALDYNICFEFSNFFCQRCLCRSALMASWAMRFARKTNWMMWMNFLKQI